MPRTKLQDKHCVPRRDPVKGLILDAAKGQHKTQKQLAEMCGAPLRTFERMMANHTDTWTLRQVFDVAKGLRIPIDELRPMIRY